MTSILPGLECQDSPSLIRWWSFEDKDVATYSKRCCQESSLLSLHFLLVTLNITQNTSHTNRQDIAWSTIEAPLKRRLSARPRRRNDASKIWAFEIHSKQRLRRQSPVAIMHHALQTLSASLLSLHPIATTFLSSSSSLYCLPDSPCLIPLHTSTTQPTPTLKINGCAAFGICVPRSTALRRHIVLRPLAFLLNLGIFTLEPEQRHTSHRS